MSAHHDMGYRSRKFWFAVFCILILFGAAALAELLPALASLYGIMAGTISAVAGLYLGSNVAQQAVTSKSAKALKKDDFPEQSP